MSILKRLNGITDLPTLPEIAIKVQQLIYSDEGDAARLAKLIQQDPSLSAKILQVANSGFYSAANRILSIPIAITRLGFNEIGQIIIATSLIKKLSKKSKILDYTQFWRHALTAAYITDIAAKMNADAFNAEQRQSLYLSGLLHDIGILIYDQFFHEEFNFIIDYAIKNELSYIEAENAVAPKETHAAIGAALLEIWKLDSTIISGVRFHHVPEKAPSNFKAIPYAVHLSEYILCNSGLGSFEGLMIHNSGNILDGMKISVESLPAYLNAAKKEVEKSDLILAIGKAEPNQLLRSV
ncbi:MAG: HDOD domain-containing protein [Chitinispirillales bacterium]|jgi:HD-like signal output (HDOD) protein|nr:HDOD domain-containing protein [Chitinispirillales bacterium]